MRVGKHACCTVIWCLYGDNAKVCLFAIDHHKKWSRIATPITKLQMIFMILVEGSTGVHSLSFQNKICFVGSLQKG
jgi:hypothetical protein